MHGRKNLYDSFFHVQRRTNRQGNEGNKYDIRGRKQEYVPKSTLRFKEKSILFTKHKTSSP